MNHEEALTHSLAGEPCPLEARDHVRACPECSRELGALRDLEVRLRAAVPPEPSGGPTVAYPPPLRGRRALGPLGWAAAAVLAAAFFGVLLGPGGPAEPTVVAGVPAGGTPAWSEANGGTLALLDALEDRLGEEFAEVPEGIDAYLDSPYEGGVP